MTHVATAPAAPSVPGADRRERLLAATLRRHQYRQDALIEVLHAAQNLYGFLTPELLWHVARQLHLPPSKVYGVATFYNFFTLKPAGRHTAVVCQGTACYIRGAPKLAAALREVYEIESGQTTADGALSALTARCVGACSLAPVAVLDGEVVSRLTPEALIGRIRAMLAGERAPQPVAANVQHHALQPTASTPEVQLPAGVPPSRVGKAGSPRSGRRGLGPAPAAGGRTR